MRTKTFKQRVLGSEKLVGTFLRTPAPEMVELLAIAGLDFICLDAEHAPFDRARTDACLAVARAMDLPAMVRVTSGSAENILQVLDAGAVGIVVPHVLNADMARAIAKTAHFGLGGRGFHGSVRWAGYGAYSMAELMEKSEAETVVFAQIEEPEGVDAAADIAAIDGIDGLFIGPADLSIGFGHTSVGSPELDAAFESVGQAAKAQGKALVTYVSGVENARDWARFGVSVHVVGSEQSFVLAGAREVVTGFRDLGKNVN